MSSSNCCFLTCIQVSQEAGQVVWYSHFLKSFPQFVVIYTVKGFGELGGGKPFVDCSLEATCIVIQNWLAHLLGNVPPASCALDCKKTSISALLTMPKPLTVWITINCGTFWKRWEYQTTWPFSWEICIQVRKQQLELDMEQQIVSKSGKEVLDSAYRWNKGFLAPGI